uniref:Uncharacterized protein n=1 Tax=Glossina pallidipes TaxID=7398 RepID=A0A1A9Z6E7_GLOPL
MQHTAHKYFMKLLKGKVVGPGNKITVFVERVFLPLLAMISIKLEHCKRNISASFSIKDRNSSLVLLLLELELELLLALLITAQSLRFITLTLEGALVVCGKTGDGGGAIAV